MIWQFLFYGGCHPPSTRVLCIFMYLYDLYCFNLNTMNLFLRLCSHVGVSGIAIQLCFDLSRVSRLAQLCRPQSTVWGLYLPYILLAWSLLEEDHSIKTLLIKVTGGFLVQWEDPFSAFCLHFLIQRLWKFLDVRTHSFLLKWSYSHTSTEELKC